jgi:predicted secreted protein
LKSRIEPSVVGDMMGIKYEADKDTGKPQKAKIVKVYNQALEERRKAGTMKVTTAEVSTEKPVDDDPTKLDF